jgi:hypothetical protein
MSEEKPAIGWYYGRLRKTFERMDRAQIAQFVRELKESHPDDSEKKLVRRVIQRSAGLSAAVGVATAGPAFFPGLGTAVSVAAIVPEEIYLVRKKCSMLLQIAAIYGFDPADDERLYEIAALAGSPSRTVEALMTARDDIRRMAARAAASIGEVASRKAAVGTKAASRGFVRRLPMLGFLLGGAINYVALRMLGKKATRFYQRLRKDCGQEAS